MPVARCGVPPVAVPPLWASFRLHAVHPTRPFGALRPWTTRPLILALSVTER